jgi:ATP-dependent RNA helicase DBP3
MAKRKQEDGLATNGSVEITSEIPAAKKARKEKSANTRDGERKSKKKSKKDDEPLDVKKEASELLPATNNGESDVEAIAKAERKALKKEKKRAEKEARKALEANKQEPNVVGDKSQADEEAREKAERKALKKAEKQAKKEAKKASKSIVEVTEDLESASLLETAARKAEKARKKAGKRTAKSEASTVETATPINGTSAASSIAHSKTESSATSPEPATPAEIAETGYQEAPGLLALPQAEVDSYLSSKEITIADDHKTSHYRPILNFSYLPITDEAERAPFKGFTSPTPIQAATWPYLLAGRDVIGVAETGSGKTIACVTLKVYQKQLNKVSKLLSCRRLENSHFKSMSNLKS